MKKFVLAAVVACAALAGCGKTAAPEETMPAVEESAAPADAPADDTEAPADSMAAPAEPSPDSPPSYSPPED